MTTIDSSSSSSSSITVDNNSVLPLHDDIVWQIALRLPTKSLMRFKSVSKQWNTMIRDPFFVKSHIGGFRGLLIDHYTDDYCTWHRIVGVANRTFASYEKDCYIRRNTNVPGCCPLWLDDKYMYYGYSLTNIEKGLCVLIDYGSQLFTLCNVATHELLDLPIKPPEQDHRQCYLGFEPVKGVYKLVRFLFDEKYGRHLWICTLREEGDKDLDWRSIDGVTQITSNFHFVRNICVNGILYLMGWLDKDQESLVAFDLRTETAPQFIPLPAGLEGRYGNSELIQLDGIIGLIDLRDELITIWILKENKTWTKSHSICDFTITYVGTLPTGEVLLARDQYDWDNPVLRIYKYNHRRNMLLNWTEISVPDALSTYGSTYGSDYCICYHEDNIVPLDHMITRSNGSSTTSRLDQS